MARISADYNRINAAADEFRSQAKRIRQISDDIENILKNMPISTEYYKDAQAKMLSQCTNITDIGGKYEKIASALGEISVTYKKSDSNAMQKGLLDSWLEKAKSWFGGFVSDTKDAIKHAYEVYNETDFSSMSDKELEEYCNALINSENLSEDDRIRVQAALDYLSKTEINSGMSGSDKKKVQLFNNLYEKVHEDEAQSFHTFFENSAYNDDGSLKEGISEEDIKNIKYIAYNSKGDCHDIFFDKIADCHVESWQHIKDDGHGDLVSDGSYYRHAAGVNNNTGEYEEVGVYLDFALGKDGIDNPRGAYNTFFHEIGHNIDDLLDDSQNGGDWFTSKNVSNGNFYDVLYDDVENNFRQSISEYSNNEAWVKIDEKGQDKILDVLMGREKQSSLNPRLSFAYRKIYEDYTGKWRGMFTEIEWNGKETGSLEGAANEQISDITGGITNNAVLGTYAHRDYSWYYEVDSNGDIVDRNGDGQINGDDHLKRGDLITDSSVPAGMQEKEFFAEYFAYEMTGDPDEAYARQYFSESYRVMDEAMHQKAEEIRNSR